MRSLIIVFLLLHVTTHLYSTSEIVRIALSDGEVVLGKLDVPTNNRGIEKLVIFVQSSGPHTYLDTRGKGDAKFNYFDLFANEFNKRGVAFFVYNRRGVTFGNKPPYYDSIDMQQYRKYLPSIEAADVAAVINQLRKDKRFKRSKIVLFGWSEGTIIAAMTADQKKAKVDALFLAGYCNETMTDIMKWQHSGEPQILALGDYFDADQNRVITRLEYETNQEPAASYRINALKNRSFEQLDVNKDSLFTREDFRVSLDPKLKAIFDAVDRKDDEWIWNNYFKVTTAWITEHDKLEPNKERLLRLNIPIYIFQGAIDGNTPVEGVYDIDMKYKARGKTNLTAFIFKRHSHDLNYIDWITRKSISEGIAKIFEVATTLK